jgi:thiaminase/transcriptional activator TenA
VEPWTQHLWGQVEDVYAAICRHPFLAGLADGSLDERAFAYYVAQDAHYLRDYARALAVVGAKAPSHAETGLFARHAADTVAVELALHATLLPQLGLDPAHLGAVPISPTTTAYTSYLLATAHGGTYAEGVAAVLPCYWIYQRVGAELVGKGSPDARYQAWIDTYGGEAFAAVVADVLAVADAVGTTSGDAERSRAERHFVTTSRYEWMFWDAAWRREGWPV